MLSVASISKESFDAIEKEFSGVIKVASLVSVVGGTYSTTTGTINSPVTQTSACRLFFDTELPKKDIFPSYTIGPSDKLAYIEGLAVTPKEADKIVIASTTYVISAVADVVGANQLFAVVLR